MIILRTPKGWTGPRVVDGKPVENTWRAHQVPLSELATKPEHLKLLEEWMKSYKPEELFDPSGKLIPELAELADAQGRAVEGLTASDFAIAAFGVTEQGTFEHGTSVLQRAASAGVAGVRSPGRSS